MKFDHCTISEAGPAHENEDRLFVAASGQAIWAAVADGVGGHGDGRQASEAAIDTFAAWAQTKPSLDAAGLFRLVQSAITERVNSGDGNSRMATTLTCFRLADSKVEFGHVGDTRLYHVRGEGIVTRSRDQSEVQEMIERGIINRRQAAKYPRRNILTSVLSSGRSYDLMSETFDVETGDTLILCSDGIHGTVNKRQVLEFCSDANSAASICEMLAAAVRSAGPSDDYSAVVVRVLPL